ncbi:MAG: hypothetical protein Q4C60_05990 [Eubacteriales bacterium]|nr:hypothetical protein [Eubacteriales bacterium]
MERGETVRKKNRIVFWSAAAAVLALFVLVSLAWDFYYDLNDDVLMKDILSGAYTGEPEPRNIQMLYPVSLLISLCYRIGGSFDWYGAFLLLCQFGALFLILWRALRERRGRSDGKTFARLLIPAVFAASVPVFLLYHLVFVQYTITTGLLAAAAAFWFLTMPLESGGGESGSGKPECYARLLLRDSLPSLLLIWLGYLIRSEMMLLLLPLVLCAALFRVLRLPDPIALRRIGATALVLAVMGGGLLISQGIHQAACGSEAWREFTRLFDARTELYDFQPQILGEGYEAHQDFYEEIGVSRESFELLVNYNYGLDDSMNADKMQAIADLAAREQSVQNPPAARLRTALYEYRQWCFGGQGRPYQPLLWLTYLLVLAAAVPETLARRRGKNRGAAWTAPLTLSAAALALLFLARTVLWLYILYNGRAPERITHSLFFVEFVIAAGLLLYNGRGAASDHCEGAAARVPLLCGAVLFAAALLVLPRRIAAVGQEYDRREQVNEAYAAYTSYCEAHPEQFYLIDVYSTVAYSEKMFADRGRMPDNYDLLGGWACKSPLQEKKFAAFGITDTAAALAAGEDVLLIAETGADLTWLSDYYASIGQSVIAEPIDQIGAYFTVYRINVSGRDGS